ncbi:MAG: tRNA (adenosine(37)-N6)-dimethylallyltransferase MiaA [Balneolaceae bacterium]
MIKKIVLLGPTASGKSELAVELAALCNGDIISVDSRQCYKYLDIGTAKPSEEQLEKIRHYNISILEPDEKDSAAKFKKRVTQWEKIILSKNKKIIFAGGSTLHLKSVIQPFDNLPPADKENLKMLEKRLETKGPVYLLNELKKEDPVYAAQMDGFNRQRVIRALDVFLQTGKPFSSFHSGNPVKPPDDMLVFGLHYPRAVLYQRINERVDAMIANGLIEETQKILNKGISKDAQALQTVGYRQVIQYLENKIVKEQMVADIKTQTRRYAKRQLTWFRKWSFIHWIKADEKTIKEMAEFINQKLAAKHQKG